MPTIPQYGHCDNIVQAGISMFHAPYGVPGRTSWIQCGNIPAPHPVRASGLPVAGVGRPRRSAEVAA